MCVRERERQFGLKGETLQRERERRTINDDGDEAYDKPYHRHVPLALHVYP